MPKTKKQLANEAALGREIKSDVDRDIILRRTTGLALKKSQRKSQRSKQRKRVRLTLLKIFP
jgi:hypothetical protein